MLMKPNGIRLLFCIGLLSSATISWATASDQLTKTINDLKDPRKVRSAELTLKKLASGTDKNTSFAARIALANHKKDTHPEQAFKYIEPYTELHPSNLTEPRVEGYLLGITCLANNDKILSALKRIDYAKSRSSGISAIRARIAHSDILCQVPDYKKAASTLKESLSYGDSYFKRKKIKAKSVGEKDKLEPPKPGHTKWPSLRKQILARLSGLARKLQIDAWGLDFVLYKEAQEARKSSHLLALDFTSLKYVYPGADVVQTTTIPNANFRVAIDKYTKIIEAFPENVFAEAGMVYRSVCFAKLGKTDQALKDLNAFYKDNPNGLYSGEALKLQADIYLQSEWNLNKAKEYYSSAISWCNKAQDRAEKAKLYSVPEKAVHQAKAPENWQMMDMWGAVDEVAIGNSAIVNRLTAKWYLNKLKEDCEFNLGFIYAVNNDWNSALKHFENAASLNKLLSEADSKGYLNAMRRLRGACRIKAFIASELEYKGLSEKEKAAIMWADMLCTRRYFQRSHDFFGRIYSAASKKKDNNAAARAGAGLMFSKMRLRKYKEALALGEKLLSKYGRAISAPYISFLCGHCGGYEDSYAVARKWYKHTYTKYPNSWVVEEARALEIFKGINHKTYEQWIKPIEKFKRDYPGSHNVACLESELLYWRKRAKEIAGQEKATEQEEEKYEK